jgi:hypothetical protein
MKFLKPQAKVPVLARLCSLFRGEKPGRGRIPEEVVALAEKTGLLDALAALPGMRKKLGKRVDATRSTAAMGALRLLEFREIVVALGSLGIPVAPMKGMAYALMFESGGPTRAMADIDLLVPPSRFEAGCTVLRGLGYREEFPVPISRAEGCEERAFVRNGRLVELHRFFLPEVRLGVDYDALWSRTREITAEGMPVRLLSPEDTLLYHCLHMGLHEFAMGLRPVWELRRLLLNDNPDLAVAAQRTREWGTQRMTWCALRLLQECWPEVLPIDTLSMFEPYPIVTSVLERFVVAPSIRLLSAPGPLPRPIQLLRKFFLLDSPIRGLAYAKWYIGARIKTLGYTRTAYIPPFLGEGK